MTQKQNKPAKREANKVALEADFGKMYLKVRPDGTYMKPVRARMALLEDLGHYYRVAKKYAISASGYSHLNKVASVSLVTPQDVTVDGESWNNPKIERNPRTKAIETVSIRRIGIGVSPAGEVTVLDKTLMYNIYTYFIQSIQAKMKKVEWKNGKPTEKKVHPNCAVTGTKDERPEKDGRWAWFETVDPLGIWVNYDDPAIIDCLEEHTQRQRFGDRIAQTIVDRNILKDHPAIGVSQIHPREKKAHVTVYGYQYDLRYEDVQAILHQTEKAGSSKPIDKVEEEEEKKAIEETAPAQEEKNGQKKEEKKEEKEPEAPKKEKPKTAGQKEQEFYLTQEQEEEPEGEEEADGS